MENRPKQICIHKSGWKDWATKEPWTIESMRDFHVNTREFRDIAYHYIINKDGTIIEGRDVKEYPASSTGHNVDVIAICVMGEFTREEPTDKQINSLKVLVLKLCKEYKIDTDMHHIFTHADYRDPPGNRYCPGKYLHRKIPEISNWVRQALQKGVR